MTPVALIVSKSPDSTVVRVCRNSVLSSTTNIRFISFCRLFHGNLDTRAKKLTPRMLNELVNHIEVHQAEKINGEWVQKLTICYNCVGALFIPDTEALPTPEVTVNTRKGVYVSYEPAQNGQ